MLKITIDGEGRREKKEFINSWNGADNEYYLRVIEHGEQEGYLKTWVTIEYNNKIILKRRLDLTIQSSYTLKGELIDLIDDEIKYYSNQVGSFEFPFQQAEKIKLMIDCLATHNKLTTMYNYKFYSKGKKVHEYTTLQPVEDCTIRKTINILQGDLEGYRINNEIYKDVVCISKNFELTI